LAAPRRRQLHPGTASFGEADRNGLFSRPSAVFALADMVHFFPNKFSGLG
jgi:hypothetical protein